MGQEAEPEQDVEKPDGSMRTIGRVAEEGILRMQKRRKDAKGSMMV